MPTVVAKIENSGDILVAQLAKCPSLDLSPGLDLRVMNSSPVLDSTLDMERT